MKDDAPGHTLRTGDEIARGDTLGPGAVLAGRYRIEAPLGRGGMGAVYTARHINMGSVVAIKVLLPEMAQHPQLIQRFAAEARAAAALAHPHIVTVHDFDHHGQLHFIVMEKLEGESLLARMEREGRLPVPFVARVGAEICDAMSAAHGGTPKIIHRDLKPENIFLAREGRKTDVVKVLDFGIAKLVEPSGILSGLTSTGQMAGTPHYMSLEQLRNTKDVDERADVYSIGVMLYHALTGTVPFSADSLAELVLAVNKAPPRPLHALRPDVPRALAAIVQRAMARNREDRFPSADALREQLLPYVQADPASGALPRGGSRRWLLLAVGAVAVGGGVVFLRARPPGLGARVQPEVPTAAPLDIPTAGPPDAGAAPASAVVAAPDAGAAPASTASTSDRSVSKPPERKPKRKILPPRFAD